MLRNSDLKSLGYSRHFKSLREKKILLPPLAIQEGIIAEIAGKEKSIAACRRLIDTHEDKIRAKIATLWGESPDGQPSG